MLNFILLVLAILFAVCVASGLSAFFRDVYEFKQPLKKFELKSSAELWEAQEEEKKNSEEENSKESEVDLDGLFDN